MDPVCSGLEQRKALPAWIREGLEKVEKDKQKEAEKERQREERDRVRRERLAAKGKSRFVSKRHDKSINIICRRFCQIYSTLYNPSDCE